MIFISGWPHKAFDISDIFFEDVFLAYVMTIYNSAISSHNDSRDGDIVFYRGGFPPQRPKNTVSITP